jgi:hypothetical protein
MTNNYSYNGEQAEKVKSLICHFDRREKSAEGQSLAIGTTDFIANS